MIYLNIEPRKMTKLQGLDALSVTDLYIGFSDDAYARIVDGVEFATGGIRVLAVRPNRSGYKVTKGNSANYICGSIVKRLRESICCGQYIFSHYQGRWAIYKMED